MSKKKNGLAGQTTKGTSAWEQLLGQRRELLDAFDSGKRKSRGHKVRTFHGRVAEAVFRDWLSRFLPKRFAVSPGYVVSQAQLGPAEFPHFDVIIYNQLDSPVLWVEDHPDMSSSGRSRAIPVEYVHGIIEVKSTFGPEEAKSAIEHLRELKPFYSGSDPPQERYKEYLPPRFFCATVFFDASKDNAKNQAVVDRLRPVTGPRNYLGGIILRGEGLSGNTGQIIIGLETKPNEAVWHAFLLWIPDAFCMFAFDVVALLNGTYDSRFLSSRHAVNFPATQPKRGQEPAS